LKNKILFPKIKMKKLLFCLIVLSLLPTSGFAISKNNINKQPKAIDIPAEKPIIPAKRLTLNDAFQAALKRSETLATQQEVVNQAEEEYKRAWGAIMPTVVGSYAYLHRDSTPSAGDVTTKITADQPLFRGFRDFAAINETRASIVAEKQAKEWAGMQLYSDVAAAFYTFLSAQKDVHVLDKELDLYAQRIKVLKERQAIGRSRNTEVLTVQSAQAILKAQREQVLGQLDVAKEVLAFLTGLNGDLQLDDSDPTPASIEAIETYQARIDARPDVVAATQRLKAAKSAVSIAKGEHLPSADLIANYYTQRPEIKRNGDWDLGITVTLPIFSGGIISSNVRTAQSQKLESELQLSQVKRLAEQEIRSLHHSLTADLAQVAALQDAFNLSEQNYKANVKDYEFGLAQNLDVLQALTSYEETERSLEKARYAAKIDYNKLEAAVANRLALMKDGAKP
jgi:outer membrane protein